MKAISTAVLILAVVALATFAASQTPPPQTTPAPRATQAPKVSITPVEGPRQYASVAEALSARVSIVARDASVDEVLGVVAQDYTVNLVHKHGIPGTVNVILDNVTLRQAITKVLEVVGYRMVETPDIVTVVPEEKRLATQVFELQNLDYSTARGKERLNELLPKMISATGQYHVIQNSVIITDEESRMDGIIRALKELDVARPQVLIEARVVELSKTDLENMGIRFSVIDVNPLIEEGFIFPHGAGATGGTTETTTQPQNRLSTLEELPIKTGGEVSSMAGPGLRGAAGNQFIFGATVGTTRIEAIIDALIQQNKGRVLSAPRITTAEGETGKILVGSQVPYVISQVNVTAGAIQQAVNFEPVGIQLAFTPQISSEGTVRLDIYTEVSSVREFINNAPLTDNTSVETTVSLDDQQTYVIAGLIGTRWQTAKGEIPILSRIPVLGILFRNRGKANERTELVVMVTPKVIREGADWERPAPHHLSPEGEPQDPYELRGTQQLPESAPAPAAAESAAAPKPQARPAAQGKPMPLETP